MTGHLLGATGAIEAIATIMAVVNDTVPPTINFKTPDPDIDPGLNLTLNKAQNRNIRYAISNTFGFGGHNASIVIKKAEV
jgi:3-oxoacyl-[acyl-carrier-protein] synthase II